jgi:hypothetical protein
MAAARKTTVTHADGTVSTRKSQTRTYSHAVEVSPAPAAAYAANLNRKADSLAARAANLRAAADAGVVHVRSRGFSTADPYISHDATLLGTDREISWHSNAAGQIKDTLTDGSPIVNARDYLVAYARKQATVWDEQAAKTRQEAADVLAAGTPVGNYFVARWSSRADLAAKALSEFDHLCAAGHAVRAVAVDPA